MLRCASAPVCYCALQKRKKPKPPPAQEPVNKARAWDDLLPAVALVGKDKKKQKG